jgi:sulfate adenylyltransferase subunit 2
MSTHLRPHLKQLESEAIFVMREVVAQFNRPALLFSGGKDSIVLVELARRAFAPGRIPFPLLHIDTGDNFPETLEFRDALADRYEVELLVRTVQDSIDRGRVVEETGPHASRNGLQTVTLLDALTELRFDVALGGARRDEEKARAKERFFSHRDRFGQWDPKQQRPELWSIFNGHKHVGEHFRVFPLSNWTELDVWHYIRARSIPVPSLYFAHRRPVFCRDGVLLAAPPTMIQHRNSWNDDCDERWASPRVETRLVRFRTVGDITCTGAVESNAVTVDDVIEEIASARVTERAGRADDQRAETAMEDRKRQGYF